MKRQVLFIVFTVVLILLVFGGAGQAAGESYDDAIEVTEGQSFSLTLQPGYKTRYYTFTPATTYLYTVSLNGNCTYYLRQYGDDGTVTATKWLYEGEGSFLLGQLTKGHAAHFSITSYQDTLEVTGTVAKAEPFTYELLSDGTASITGFAVRGDIVIPDKIDGHTVTNLKSQLFSSERGITSVTVPATVTYFGSSKTSVDFDYVFSYCYDLQRIVVASGNKAFKSVDGVLYTKDGSHLINYPCAKAGESYHTSAKYLSCTAFASCANLKYLYLENIQTSWMGYTFYNTPALTTLYRPGGSTESAARSFAENHAGDETWCTMQLWDPGLTPDFALPAELKPIESGAFAGIADTVIGVPDTVTAIADDAFDPSVTLYCSIGSAAQAYCDEKGIAYIVK